MLLEIVAALILGTLAIALVVEPVLRRRGARSAGQEYVDPEETPRGRALAALKEIEFDRATGKLSDEDYQALNAKYTAVALEAMRDEESAGAGQGSAEAGDALEAMIARKVRALRSGPAGGPPDCPSCGPRPESDAVFCSSCGGRLPTGAACDGCGAALPPDGRFCEICGHKVAA